MPHRYVIRYKSSYAFYLLNNAAGVHLAGQIYHLAFHHVGKNLFLYLVAMLEKLLNNIIAEHIFHQLYSIWFNFAEHLVLFIAVGAFKLGLDKSRAMLVAAKLNDVVINIL